ncbi:hypothetical protein ABFS83_04G207500 [Erythranthe nasuta]
MAFLGHHRSEYDQVFFGSVFSETRGARSTSQTCLHRILRIITTVPPPPLSAASPPLSVPETKESSVENDGSGENEGPGFDSKAAFCVIPPEPKESFAAAAAVEGGGSAAVHGGGYCEANLEIREENENGVAENSHDEIEGEEEEEADERSFILLIEAAKLIFGEFEENGNPESGELKKDEAAEADTREPNGRKSTRRRSSCWTAAEEMGGGFHEETPSLQVVRSNRGRTPVLPFKYRDSVLEPLTRLSRPGSSVFPSKRRRR